MNSPFRIFKHRQNLRNINQIASRISACANPERLCKASRRRASQAVRVLQRDVLHAPSSSAEHASAIYLFEVFLRNSKNPSRAISSFRQIVTICLQENRGEKFRARSKTEPCDPSLFFLSTSRLV